MEPGVFDAPIVCVDPDPRMPVNTRGRWHVLESVIVSLDYDTWIGLSAPSEPLQRLRNVVVRHTRDANWTEHWDMRTTVYNGTLYAKKTRPKPSRSYIFRSSPEQELDTSAQKC